MTLDWATKWIILLAGSIFVWALALGVWKYRQIMTSPDGHAHPYVDIAHRAALMYSFATMLLAVFVQFSRWPDWVNLLAALAVIVFFVGAIAGYQWHGTKRDTVNQFLDPAPGLGLSMIALIVVEITGTLVLLAGFVAGQLF